MDAEGFKNWLIRTKAFKNPKVIRDYVSRAKRVENAFCEVFPKFSYENEYEKDKCQNLIRLISRRGAAIDFKIDLPLNTNQMDAIASAAKKYIQYLDQF